ncbi:hypothetical protein NtRootA1_47140 [Arthrobacter sp. NtRootA1]|nr:hypothetical protein NtRootA1_47140 [Arthrobacter sp. NtRootA1]
MDVPDDIRARVVEDLIAAFQSLEIRVQAEFPALQHGAHGAIGNDDALVDRIQERLGADRAGDRIDVKGKTRHINRVRVRSDTVLRMSVYYDGGWLSFAAGRSSDPKGVFHIASKIHCPPLTTMVRWGSWLPKKVMS